MSTPSPATGYVLAGGQSRRLGRDKSLLPWQKGTLLEHMTRLIATVCHQVFIAGHQTPILKKKDDQISAWLPDRIPGLGPLGGISTSLHASSTDQNIVVAVDLPFLTSDFLKYFKERLQRTDRLLTACKIESAYPLCLGVQTAFAARIDEYIAEGRRSVRGLVETADVEIITLEDLRRAGFSADIFANINTESDYRAALRTI